MKKILLVIAYISILIVIGIIIFKPYIKYDKFAYNNNSYQTRTNLITGKTEVFAPLILKWVDFKDLENDNLSSNSSSQTGWDKIKAEREAKMNSSK